MMIFMLLEIEYKVTGFLWKQGISGIREVLWWKEMGKYVDLSWTIV